jgi:hypothetical protein
MTQPRYWIGVVSHSHVEMGVAAGVAQLGHGKEQPLRRLSPSDWLIYYLPKTAFEDGTPLQAFTAVGEITDDRVYQHQMTDDFTPYRRDVAYLPCQEAPIAPLLDDLSFIKDEQRWGFPFRAGLIEIPESDFTTITAAMGVNGDSAGAV